jgi:uncharacterized protein YjbI with pentapeptide repeats
MLEGADLSKSDLFEADFRSADLRLANLNGAFLRRTCLVHADLTGATGLTQDQIDDSLGDGFTRLPSGLFRPRSWLLNSESGQMIFLPDGRES